MLFPSTASIESERFVIVGTIKSWISSKLHRGERQKRVCAFKGCLKLLVLQYMDFCVELEWKKRWVIPYKVSLVIPYTV